LFKQLFAQQIIQHLRYLRSGRRIRREQLAAAAVDDSSTRYAKACLAHSATSPLSAKSVKTLPESSLGNLFMAFIVLHNSVNIS